MNTIIAYNGDVVADRFCRAISLANIDGWMFFKDRVLGNVSDRFRVFIEELRLDPIQLRSDKERVEECIALLLESLSPLPDIRPEIIELISDVYFFKKAERPGLLEEGLVFLQNNVPKFYQGYQDFIEMLYGHRNQRFDCLLAISWVVVLVIKRAYDEDPTLALVNSFGE